MNTGLSDRDDAGMAGATHVHGELSAVLAMSEDGLVVFDRRGCVRHVSPAFCHLSGLRQAQLTGLDEESFWAQLALLCEPQQAQAGVQQLRLHLRQPQSERRSVLALVRPRPCMLRVSQRLSDSAKLSVMLIFRDVTRELELDRVKSEFLSNAAHELRSPLASIYGFAEALLTQSCDDASRSEFTGIIYQQAQAMATLLDDMLDLARIEARRQSDFSFESVAAQTLVQAALAICQPAAGHAVASVDAPEAALLVRVDRAKAQQVLLNVLSNAYKYSGAGGDVALHLASLVGEGGAAQVCITISDNGIGMTPEQCARVFERFYRANASPKVSGSGLGMSIVQEIMRRMHGRVEVHSSAGVGTSVKLYFPGA